MSPTTSDDSLGPVTPLAMTGTLRLRTRTVITVAKIPSVSASNLPLPRPGMSDPEVNLIHEASLPDAGFKACYEKAENRSACKKCNSLTKEFTSLGD